MISYEIYKIAHVAGILLLFLAFGGALAHSANGGTKQDNSWRKTIGILHGVGLFLLLVAGFGMLARLQIHWPWPGWVIGKFVAWLVLGGLLVAAHRAQKNAVGLLLLVFALGVFAAWSAVVKPF